MQLISHNRVTCYDVFHCTPTLGGKQRRHFSGLMCMFVCHSPVVATLPRCICHCARMLTKRHSIVTVATLPCHPSLMSPCSLFLSCQVMNNTIIFASPHCVLRLFYLCCVCPQQCSGSAISFTACLFSPVCSLTTTLISIITVLDWSSRPPNFVCHVMKLKAILIFVNCTLVAISSISSLNLCSE